MTSSQGLRPAKLLRVASLVRSSPLISAASASTGTIRREPSPQSLRADHSFRRDFHSVGSNRRSQAVPCQHPALRVQEFESDLRGGWKGEFFEVPKSHSTTSIISSSMWVHRATTARTTLIFLD